MSQAFAARVFLQLWLRSGRRRFGSSPPFFERRLALREEGFPGLIPIQKPIGARGEGKCVCGEEGHEHLHRIAYNHFLWLSFADCCVVCVSSSHFRNSQPGLWYGESGRWRLAPGRLFSSAIGQEGSDGCRVK
ncbi:hypothetical protein IE53DRAFT_386694 [Violaceomyces palustris]|uniref:Uncharacterized protein n=1 Tax=Violaceomyces palustris TaxID=1673888 RepID=A0ACD0NZ68_9BASI|nr:hypothetical protein IE53DRAFT_386694 [Violaceomyces palustris]